MRWRNDASHRGTIGQLLTICPAMSAMTENTHLLASRGKFLKKNYSTDHTDIIFSYRVLLFLDLFVCSVFHHQDEHFKTRLVSVSRTLSRFSIEYICTLSSRQLVFLTLCKNIWTGASFSTTSLQGSYCLFFLSLICISFWRFTKQMQ